MNSCHFLGRTTKDVEVRYAQESNMAIGRTSIAVDNGYGDNRKTSFFDLTAFGKVAENMEKHCTKGTKIAVTCSANQNVYTNKDGKKVSSIDFIVQSWEYAQSKNESERNAPSLPPMPSAWDGFMNIPDGIDEELPFN